MKVEGIIRSISYFYDILEQKIFKKGYRTEQSETVTIAIYITLRLVGCSYSEIAKRFSGMGVAAVAKSIQRFNEKIRRNDELKKRCATLSKTELVSCPDLTPLHSLVVYYASLAIWKQEKKIA